MPKFAKRHYEAIAATMQLAAPTSPNDPCEATWAQCVLHLAQTFAANNASFDVMRFQRACIPGANVRSRAA